MYTGKTHTVMSSDGMCVHVVEKLFKRIKLDKYHDYQVNNQRDNTGQQQQNHQWQQQEQARTTKPFSVCNRAAKQIMLIKKLSTSEKTSFQFNFVR